MGWEQDFEAQVRYTSLLGTTKCIQSYFMNFCQMIKEM